MQSIPMQKNLGAFARPCTKHPGSHLSDICRASGCTERLLCPECRKEHDASHVPFFEAFVGIVVFDARNEVTRLKELAQQATMEVQKLDDFFSELKKKFELVLQEVRAEILMGIFGIPNDHPAYWDDWLNNLEIKRNDCLKYN